MTRSPLPPYTPPVQHASPLRAAAGGALLLCAGLAPAVLAQEHRLLLKFAEGVEPVDLRPYIAEHCTEILRHDLTGHGQAVKVRAPAALTAAAREVAGYVQGVYDVIAETLGASPSVGAVVYLLPLDEPEAYRYESWGAPGWEIVLFCGDPGAFRGIAADPAGAVDLFTGLPHELAHEVLRFKPRWFEDGVCGYVELRCAERFAPSIARAFLRQRRPAESLALLRGELLRWNRRDLRKLERWDGSAASLPFDERVNAYYGAALQAVRELVAMGGEDLLRRLVARARAGRGLVSNRRLLRMIREEAGLDFQAYLREYKPKSN